MIAIGALAIGAMTLPAATTTASAVETQAFVLVYMVGTGLAAQILVGRLRTRRGNRAFDG